MSYHVWPTLRVGSKGHDVIRLQQLLDGGNRYGFNTHPGPADGIYGEQTADAVRRMKWHLGYPMNEINGHASERLHAFMVTREVPQAKRLPLRFRMRLRKRHSLPYPGETTSTYPLSVRGQIIGVPYEGTHLDFHNWESDNAIDISAHVGTPVLAVANGQIGDQIGPLDSGNPQLLGQRLHLVTGSQEWYYAHLSRIVVRARQNVRKGQILGYSGSANGVAHLHFAQHHGDPGALVGSPSPGYRDRNYPG